MMISGQFLMEQKKAIDDLLQYKNKLLQEYSNEIKSKDDEYVKELKRQAEEIDVLVERMNKQYKSFQVQFIDELEQIEKSFVEERNDLITSNFKEVEGLLGTRRKTEAKFSDERANRIEDHVSQLENLRVQDSEEYNLVKIKLETDVQVLEQQLQQVGGFEFLQGNLRIIANKH
jgi:dynein regulatory complex protein 1